MRILVVDDDEATRKAMARGLEDFEVLFAASGSEAINLLSREPVDLLLLDMVLGPGPDGWDVARFRAYHPDPRVRATPTIIVSGLSAEEVRARAYNHSLEDVNLILEKPIDVAKLTTILRSMSG